MKADFRHLARRFVPRAAYQALRDLANLRAIFIKEGAAKCRALASRDGAEVTLTFKSLRQPFTFRRINSHVDGIVQNVLRGEYDAHPPMSDPKVMIDAGGFIGDLTCHWATRYPQARIITLEPNPENFRFAQLNIDRYAPNALLLNMGLWSCNTRLGIAGEEMGSHLVDDPADAAESIAVIDVPTLMKEQGLTHIDVLKLDIEGAEAQVLGDTAAAWLPLVTMLIVEMHGQHIEDAILPPMQQAGFQARRFRSLVYFTRPA